jgi:hypothetical protein
MAVLISFDEYIVPAQLVLSGTPLCATVAVAARATVARVIESFCIVTDSEGTKIAYERDNSGRIAADFLYRLLCACQSFAYIFSSPEDAIILTEQMLPA